ncbi:MAG: hypothetical protein A3K18_10375 [Lentisphaerae bacterium RIFOXYA12_64_32]|nr:MAG: hypothetical protein A3K18_10375 [Lentisphaerae bacterium RIFOXYA12_64_32]
MNRRQLVYLILAAALLVLIGVTVANARKKTWEATGTAVGQKVLPDLPVNDVTMIEVVDGDKTLQVVKKEDKWRVAQRYDFPADYTKVSELLRNLMDLKAVQQPVVGESQYGRLKLLPPGKGDESGILLDLSADGGKKVASLLLGKEHERKSGDNDMGMMGMGGGSWPDGRYLLVPDTKKLVLVSETFRTTKADPAEWLDKEFVKISDLKTGTLSQDGQEVWKVTRANKADEMKLDGLAAGEEQDDNKVRSIKTAFSWASFVDVADPKLPEADTGMATPRTFVGEDFDGFTYTVKIGAKLADGRQYLAANVEFSSPVERVAEADEKPEDKAKKDEEFKKKLEENQKKATDLRQRLKDWVFIVNSSTVDSILKERKDLLKEKKKDDDKAKAGAGEQGQAPAADAGLPVAEGAQATAPATAPAAAALTPPPPPVAKGLDAKTAEGEGDEPAVDTEGDVQPEPEAANPAAAPAEKAGAEAATKPDAKASDAGAGKEAAGDK